MQQNMKFTKKALLPAFFLLAMLMAACGGGSSSSSSSSSHTKAPDNKQVYVSTYVGGGLPDINSFDPAKAPDLYSAFAIETVFTGLVSLDNNLNV